MLVGRAVRRIGRLLAPALLAGCAKIEPPPGAPPDAVPPQLVSSYPESLAVLPAFKGDVSFRFDEVISEGSQSQGAGTSEIERLIILSPTTRPPNVRWRRDRITVHPREGWLPNRVYRVELLPGAVDLRNNRSTSAAKVVTFTTGAPKPTYTVTGVAWDWVANRAAAGALVEAILQPDSLAYRMIADSSGRFRLGPIPDGEYLVSAAADQNRNLQRDAREAFDTVRLAAGKGDAGRLWMFPHDTVGPRIQTIFTTDSMSASVTLSQPLDPAQRLTPAAATVRLLPDSTPVKVVSILPPSADDSAFGRKAETKIDTTKADTTKADTTKADTAKAELPRPAGTDTVPARPSLSDRLVIRVDTPWQPGGKYTIDIKGLRSISGVTADARGGLIIPEPPKAPPADTTTAQPKRAPADTTSTPAEHLPADSADTLAKPRPKPK